jgi:hypothetical protein
MMAKDVMIASLVVSAAQSVAVMMVSVIIIGQCDDHWSQ